MAPNLAWLNACKVFQLKTIALAIGINSSGPKTALTSHLSEHLQHGLFNHDASKGLSENLCNIISIDMGIRNLAYCRLKVPQPPPASRAGLPLWNANPVITEWARIEISKKAKISETLDGLKEKEAFDPATYSQHAYDLVTTLLGSTTSRPTHILIERQRFRSMGGSAVQEWTLRVNMFEAMIYAVLKTFSETGTWQGDVYPVAPARVSRFWLGDKEGADAEDAGRGSKSAKTKTAKINLVGKWLKERQGKNNTFTLEGKAEELGRAYLQKRNGVKRVKAEPKDAHVTSEKATMMGQVGKLDDLADCLLQGMAWVKWEQNRRLILTRGSKALDDLR